MKPEAKEKILTAAKMLFSRYGVWKTGMGEIAKHARVAKATLYSVYSSKEEILRDVVESELAAFWQEMASRLAAAEGPDGKLREFLKARTEMVMKMASVYTALKDEYIENYSFTEKLREKHLIKEINLIKSLLIDAKKNGIFDVPNPDVCAAAIATASKGVEVYFMYDVKKEDAEKHLEMMIDLIFYGLKKR